MAQASLSLAATQLAEHGVRSKTAYTANGKVMIDILRYTTASHEKPAPGEFKFHSGSLELERQRR